MVVFHVTPDLLRRTVPRMEIRNVSALLIRSFINFLRMARVALLALEVAQHA